MKTLLLTTGFIFSLAFAVNAQSIGDNAPDFTVDKLGGGTFTLSDYAGKTVFIFSFGFNCGNCIAAGDDIQADIIEEYSANEGFVAISVDVWNGTVAQVNSFLASTGITGFVGIQASNVASAFGVPNDRLLLVGKNGKILHKSGGAAIGDISTVKGLIDGDLATSSVNDISEETAFKVYPNPAKETIYIHSLKESAYTVSVYNYSGKNITEMQGTSLTTIATSGFEPGVYFIQIASTKGVTTERIIIQ